MRRANPIVAIVLVVVVLFVAAGIVASVMQLSQHMEKGLSPTLDSGLFLLLVALGAAVLSAAAVALGYWYRRRQRH